MLIVSFKIYDLHKVGYVTQKDISKFLLSMVKLLVLLITGLVFNFLFRRPNRANQRCNKKIF